MTSRDRPRAAVILAAGKSTRMKSAKSKVLHELAGRPLLGWVHDVAAQLDCERIVCVVGEANTDVRAAAEALGMRIAVQEPQLGTGHAVLCAREALDGFDGDVAIMFADTPMITAATMGDVFGALNRADVAVLGFEADTPMITAATMGDVFGALDKADVAVLGFETDTPGAYGRLVEESGALQCIVEAKDANADELAITLCNSGVLAADAQALLGALDRVGNDNAKGEYYLTDVVGILREDGGSGTVVRGKEAEMLGINSRQDLAEAHKAFQANMRRDALADGVTLRDPDTVYFSYDTHLAPDVTVAEHVVFGPGVTVKRGATIEAFSHIAGATVGEGASVGPFARLRPGAELGPDTKIGNFVEVKKAVLGRGSKASHLTYLGDATIGEDVNIGAGTVTCNYDGYNKHHTTVGDRAFIGVHTSLVAPVTVGEGAFIGTGTVVTQDVSADALALARPKQIEKAGWAARFHAAMRKRKGAS